MTCHMTFYRKTEEINRDKGIHVNDGIFLCLSSKWYKFEPKFHLYRSIWIQRRIQPPPPIYFGAKPNVNKMYTSRSNFTDDC